MSNDVWILGGTGRSAQKIAAELRQRHIEPVLVGRNAERLAAAAGESGRTVVSASIGEIVDEVRRQRPQIVINTIAPFADTAAALIATGVHYIDIANDRAAFSSLFERDAELASAGQTAVTGAGFGVTASESILVKLLEGRPAPTRVRVDMVPSMETEAGKVGESLAASLIGGLAYRDRAAGRLGSRRMRLTLPDGTDVLTASMPLGDGSAAARTSGAPVVIGASSMAPTGAFRFVMPVATALLSIRPLAAFAQRLLARMSVPAAPRPREYSWGHARVEWSDGTVRDGWLRVDDASTFTGIVPAEIARRLLDGSGRPGAFTPTALFGTSLAEACGAEYLPGYVRA
ncbi:saccharopine dehydrogenase NADP-binding domain-containing protein [Paramicrobacterium fandaimingii]|uniref:saccharopine dehydrogenase NADP-binding domain-containing protein n=1 Tax=Paramicrobacterium fandaimingii TaxID=2708079 RepID=UPI001AB046E7|nr:saccharopine dehydrogenase NADP-binding domain-containing protein [Microbacterium fandaimingii]